jgi:hypothetical protein
MHGALLHALACVIAERPRESLYPVERSGRPDLRYYTAPLARYIAMYQASLAPTRGGWGQAKRQHALRLHGQWGMIACGAEARPYAQSLLAHADAEVREDAAAILAAIAATPPQA